MAPPSSTSPALHPPRSHLFTPIQEGNESEETTAEDRRRSAAATPNSDSYIHVSTPLHVSTPKKPPKNNSGRNRRPEFPSPAGSDRTVSCNNCRPTARDKPSSLVVPVDPHHPSPNLFKSLITNLTHKSPKTTSYSTKSPKTTSSKSSTSEEDQWRLATSELSQKLLHANRKRDEAVLEASRLKYSMAELEKKLNKLEHYCHTLKSNLENYTQNNPNPNPIRISAQFTQIRVENHDVIIKNFLVSVSEARSSIRILSRALTSQLKLMGVKVFERLSTILRSYDIKLSSTSSNNPTRSLQFYLEALLSAAFHEDFESTGFTRSGPNPVLNPVEKAELNFVAFNDLKDLAWEEVLSKGTKHFSEEFSRFCDRKMSEIVGMLGWTRPWPEQLLQAFFGASKSVWLVHLLANSVHPGLGIFRVGNGARFDPVYMEDMGGDRAKKLVPTMVRIMVQPGFYVGDSVVKCKVLCRYYSTTSVSSANTITSNSSGFVGVHGEEEEHGDEMMMVNRSPHHLE